MIFFSWLCFIKAKRKREYIYLEKNLFNIKGKTTTSNKKLSCDNVSTNNPQRAEVSLSMLCMGQWVEKINEKLFRYFKLESN